MRANGGAPFPSAPLTLEAFDQYLRELKRLPEPLEREEEQELARRARAGDGAAREHLVLANLRFVISYVKGYQGRGLDLADLVAIGNEGLVEAVDRFDPDSGNKFITYGVWWVRQRVLQALSEQAHAVRIPLSAGEGSSSAVRKAYEQARRPAVSLEAPLPGEGDRTLLDLLPGPDGMERKLELRFDREWLQAVMDERLTEREQLVLALYHGLDRGEVMTLEQIGQLLGVTRERVRQIREAAVEKLKH